MNLDASWGTIAGALGEAEGRALTIGPGRWHVLFDGRQRPLLMPAGDYRMQKRCLRYFVGNRMHALCAHALLKANALAPAAGLLREVRLPSAHRVLPRCELPQREPSHAAIQIGTEGPYQKASLLLTSADGDPLALAKMALVPSADHMVTIEGEWLKKLEDVSRLDGHVPKLLAEGSGLNGRRYLVTTLAPSTAVSRAFTPEHAMFLAALGRARLDSTSFDKSTCLQYLEQTLAHIERYVPAESIAELRAALDDCRKSLAGWVGPFVIAQGDFASWNIRVHEKGIFVFDWEYARTGANSLADVLHYLSIERALSALGLGVRMFSNIMRRTAGLAGQLYPEWSWRPRVVSGLALAYLLEVLLHYTWASRHLDGQHPVIKSYWHLMQTRPHWMVAP